METAVLQVTTACPLSCPQCYMRHTGVHMPLSTALNALTKAKELGANAVQLTGGEPMVYPWLTDIIQECTRRDMLTIVATSGYSYPRLLELKAAGLGAVCVSLNSIDPEVNGLTRQAGSLAVKAIRQAIRLGLPCFVNLVLTPDTVQTLPQTADTLEGMGVSGLVLLKWFPNSNGEGGSALSSEELSRVRECVCQKRNFIQVERCYTAYWTRYYGLADPCTEGGRRSIFWSVDGMVSPCSQKNRYAYPSVEAMHADADRWSGKCQ